jgi:glycerophosphoryl diester phosphodiesterase
MLQQIEIQSLEFEALEIVRRLNSQIPIGYLMSVNARHPEKLPVDFLSVQMSRVDARFLRRAHKKGQKVYVWTVDDEQQMEKAMALGVDGLITNRSNRAAAFVKEWAALSPDEKALRRLKFWLAR